MEQMIQVVLLAVWDWLADRLRDEYFLLWLGLLVGIGSIVKHAANGLIQAQCVLTARLEDKFEKLSDKLESLEETLKDITVNRLMTGIHRQISYKYGESNGEAIRRWLDYRADYGRSSPHLDEDDARAEALEEVFKKDQARGGAA